MKRIFAERDNFELIKQALVEDLSEVEFGALMAIMNERNLTQNAELISHLVTKLRVQQDFQSDKIVADIVGTGGDGHNTFNASTVAAMVVSQTGLIKMAKHGNKSSSSSCGSADLVEAMGRSLMECDFRRELTDSGFTFLYAPRFYPSLKRVSQMRKQLGVATIYNLIGPLLNPLKLDAIVLGVYKKELMPVYIECLRQQQVQSALVVHGDNGLDEISPCGVTHCLMYRNLGLVSEFQLTPADFGCIEHSLDQVKGGDPQHNMSILNKIKEYPAIVDFVAINAAAVLVLAGKASSWREGYAAAKSVKLLQ